MPASAAPGKALLQWAAATQKGAALIFSSYSSSQTALLLTSARLPTSLSLTPFVLSSGAARRCFATHYYCAHHPVFQQHHLYSASNQHHQRIRQNVSRLYARRIMEIAAASAATHKFLAQMEAAAAPRPANWQNWSRKEWSQELLQSLGDRPVTRLWAAAKRLASLSVLAAPLAVLYPLSLVSESAERLSWKYALWGIEQAGPTFVKLFQWATTRQDLFSPEFCLYFGKLQDETAGHSWRETAQILHEDLGLPAPTRKKKNSNRHDDNHHDDVNGRSSNDYLELDHAPIGSGCIAQVYRGRLKRAVGQYPQGTEVAVKVQHPRIWQKVCADFYIMGMVAQWLEAIPYANLQYLSLVDTVRQFRDVMLPQLDLTLEAKHLTRFNRDFGDDATVSFPKALNELTTTRVLTETFIHGTPILHYVNAPEEERKQVALLGLTTTLKMIFLHDFLHGDLHPGNCLISRDKTVKGHPLRLHLLDCGLVFEMGPDQHVNLVKILGAFMRRDGQLAGQLMVDTSNDSQASALDVKLFVEGIERIVVNDEQNNFLEKIGDYIADICFLACRRKVKLEACFINAALSVEIMEGIASALYPTMKVTTVALPIVLQAEMMHRLPKFNKIW